MDRYCVGSTETLKHERMLMKSPNGDHCTCSYVCPVCNGGRILIPCHCKKTETKRTGG